MAEALRKIEPNEALYRSAPNNVEAEQALLGAVLVVLPGFGLFEAAAFL
jgi:replicative DNA helicase